MNELNSTPESGWDQLRPIIDETMDGLNERDREVVLLRFFENRPLAEIGTKLRLSPDAARMRIDRALEKLRTRLATRGIASTSAALAAAFVSQSAMAAPTGLVGKVALGALSQSGVATAATFGLFKILTSGLVGSLGVGFAVYEIKQIDPPPVLAAAPLYAGGVAGSPGVTGASAASSPAAAPAEMPPTAGVRRTTDDFGWPQVSAFAGDQNPRQTHTFVQFRARVAQDPEFRAVVIEFAQYIEYRRDLVQWTAVNAITRRLQATPTPLTEEQANKLVVLLRDSLLRLKYPFTFDLGYGAGLFCSNIGSALTQRIYNQAGEFLSEPQVAVLRQLQRHATAQSD
jgi:hypothetical protein